MGAGSPERKQALRELCLGPWFQDRPRACTGRVPAPRFCTGLRSSQTAPSFLGRTPLPLPPWCPQPPHASLDPEKASCSPPGPTPTMWPCTWVCGPEDESDLPLVVIRRPPGSGPEWARWHWISAPSKAGLKPPKPATSLTHLLPLCTPQTGCPKTQRCPITHPSSTPGAQLGTQRTLGHWHFPMPPPIPT